MGKIRKMKNLLILILFFCSACLQAQLTCEAIAKPGTLYKRTDHKNGRGRLFHTDSTITSQMKYNNFELKLYSELSKEDKAEIEKYKIKLEPADTVMIYDWDIMHQGKIGYHGKAVAKVRINCADSMITTYKYLLKPETKNYVPNRFKIFKIHENDFIISDRNHPYLNINVYFKKDQ
jgi:hypothetical protein